MSLTADPAEVAAWERRPATLLDAFQLIADGVTAVGGFGVAAISVVRGPYLVVEAVSGSDEARAQLQGTRTTVTELLDEISVADDWGSFRFLPHDRIDPDKVAGYAATVSRNLSPEYVNKFTDHTAGPYEPPPGRGGPAVPTTEEQH